MKGFFNDKNVLVTGATGFLGYWLTKALVREKAQIVILVRDHDPQSTLIQSDLIQQTRVIHGALEDFVSVERAINEHEIDTVFHLGAQTIVGTALRNPLSTFESNIRGTYNLLEACRQHKNLVKRIVVASSDKAYGSSPTLPYTEEMPLRGQHPYDVSKSCTDLLSDTYHHTYGLPIVIARCGNLYGGGDLNWSRLIPGTIKNFHSHIAPVIRSDGTYTRDYLYVEDAAQAYLMLAFHANKENVRGQAFNFGPNKPYSVLEIVSSLQRLMGRSDLAPQIRNEAKEEIRNQSLDSQKARKIFDWQPLFTLEEGLQHTINWYRNYFKNMLTEDTTYESRKRKLPLLP
ncbi:MAG: GDP-mannose 4,6-dehydratase [Ignavibacteriae bacterium]|nr:GDP-mannose 4,6-dehydratase [Ignavibacteriota bacterium]